VIEAGYKIKVGIVEEAVHGVDTEEQLIHLNNLIGQLQIAPFGPSGTHHVPCVTQRHSAGDPRYCRHPYKFVPTILSQMCLKTH
jgi:hypothetical protein